MPMQQSKRISLTILFQAAQDGKAQLLINVHSLLLFIHVECIRATGFHSISVSDSVLRLPYHSHKRTAEGWRCAIHGRSMQHSSL
ncbi:hypothetical protein [Pantoea stewartii]|uniref:hypothetical protein n=2 Tax=Erwiniaceae TaxID=1903409 RepID=UPI0010709F3A|nr:hypothetical protein [Pantoea stewartii]